MSLSASNGSTLHFIQNWQTPRRLFLLILVLFWMLGLLYSVSTPILEASDEIKHFPYVVHLAAGNPLPVQLPGQETAWGQEGSQPPLYYLLSAALIRWIDTSDLPQRLIHNPHAQIGIPLAGDNKNMLIHSAVEAFPWQGTTLAVHLLRIFSLLLATGTLLCTYGLGRILFPTQPWISLGAMAIHAFIPMFLFISASVNNDNLIIFLAALSLLYLARLIRFPQRTIPLWPLGLLLGLACLSKLSGLVLLPLSAVALLLRYWLQTRTFVPLRWLRQSLNDGGLLAGMVVAVAGWWYLRNWLLYGDLTGLGPMLEIVGSRPSVPSLGSLRGEFQGFLINFWGLFGGVNILMQPGWVYPLLNGMALLAAGGLLLWFYRTGRRQRPSVLLTLILLAGWTTAVFVALIRWTMMTYASQGRLIFPALSAIALFMVLGIGAYWPRRYQGRVVGGLALALLILATSLPFTAIRPAYALPVLLRADQLPAEMRPYEVTYGERLRLLGYTVSPQVLHVDDALTVTLYWQALAPMQIDYTLYLQLSGLHGERFIQIDSYLGAGLYPSSRWLPGEIRAERYQRRLSVGASQPTAAFLDVGVYDLATGERLPAQDAAGNPVDRPYLTRLKLDVPTSPPAPIYGEDVNFNNQIRLLGYDLDESALRAGNEAAIRLHWQSLRPTGLDYSIFIHLVDVTGTPVRQADGPPLDNAYPTSFWGSGEFIDDLHHFPAQNALPAGSYRVLVGFYEPVTGQRLPIVDESGGIVGDSAAIARFEVRE